MSKQTQISIALDHIEKELGSPGAFESLGLVRQMIDSMSFDDMPQDLRDRYDEVRHECYEEYRRRDRSHSKDVSGDCVILYYNPQDGYRVVGPFDNHETAHDYAHSWGKVVDLLSQNPGVCENIDTNEYPVDPVDVESELRNKGIKK